MGVPAALLVLWIFVSFFVVLPFEADVENWHHIVNALARYFIGFPGGLLAAYGLRVHAIRRIQPLNVPVIFNTLRVAGIALGTYAILGGLIPAPVNFFPGDLLNARTFEQFVGVPLILFRTLSSLVIAISVIRSLEIFTLETQRKIEELEQQLKVLLLPKDSADQKSAILEVRAGTGGEEAALFAGDLFRMYQRYADAHGWKVAIISASESSTGGYKEIIANITGKGVFARLKFESGVHRVQRVPETEAQGRIHTSAATVAAEVWMRPCASVAGTRCTRCTPDSNFSRANTPLPVTDAMISL